MTSTTYQDVQRIINRLYNNGQPNRHLLHVLKNVNSLTNPRSQPTWALILTCQNQYQNDYKYYAIYEALHLYAIYQQAQSNQKASLDWRTKYQTNLFSRLGEYRPVSDSKNYETRVGKLLRSQNFHEACHELDTILRLYKSKRKKIGNLPAIDFAQLAVDLEKCQYSPQEMNQIRLQWGKAYYNAVANNMKGTNKHD